MTNIMTTTRAGYSDVPRGTEQTHILIVLVEDRPGAADRVVSLLRRKRANALSLSLGPTDQPGIVRITALVKDSDVTVDNLTEQVRKVVDVRQVTNMTTAQATVRELVLITVAITAENTQQVLTTAENFGATAVDVSADAITFEVAGGEAKLKLCLEAFQAFEVRDIARSGCVATARHS